MPPVHDVLPVVIARGQSQGLDHAVGGRVIVVDGLVGEADAHEANHPERIENVHLPAFRPGVRSDIAR